MRTGLLILALASGCGGQPEPAPDAAEPIVGSEAGPAATPARADDIDGDGLCQATELHVGSDPERADTDGDGLPDLVEAAYDLGVLDPTEPLESRLALLPAQAGATLEFEVRVTVTGTGEEQVGSFDADVGVYDDGTGAYDFYEGASAASADPPDNVRGIDEEAQTFSSVVGDTRLSFILRFRQPPDPPSCLRAYPFRYIVKSPLDDVFADETYLLVTVPPDADIDSGPWCSLDTCL